MEKLTETNYVDLAENVIVEGLERDRKGNFRDIVQILKSEIFSL